MNKWVKYLSFVVLVLFIIALYLGRNLFTVSRDNNKDVDNSIMWYDNDYIYVNFNKLDSLLNDLNDYIEYKGELKNIYEVIIDKYYNDDMVKMYNEKDYKVLEIDFTDDEIKKIFNDTKDYNIVKVIFETDNKLENLDVEKLNYKINRQEVIRQNIVKTAQAQVGNTGETYWEWYGFNHRVEWCCVFVSWLAHENGVLNKAIPKFIWVKKGVDFYKEKGWLKFPKEYTPIAGDVIFYDWNNNLVIDHVGIVEKVENGYVYAIEGNVNYKNVARRKLKLSSSFIYAYGVPEY